LLLAVPAVAYFVGPLRRSRGQAPGSEFADAGPLADIPVGEWQLKSLELVQADGWRKNRVRHAVWVRRQGEGDGAITVLSPICPHLGCPTNWRPNEAQFFCPCHGGIFDANGQRSAGPPPRALDRLEHEIRHGRLWVRWVDYKIGVSQQVPVSV
jgi:menaquinol-cytochrome c reductase iron-sulfur subunit